MRKVLTVQQATRLSLVTTDSTPVEADPVDEGTLGGNASGIIYRPGGVSGGNVFATAAEVKTVIAESNGAVVVFVDASAAPTPGTALWPDTGTGASIGVTDCLGTVEIRAYGNSGTPLPTGPVNFVIQDGASFKNLRKFGPNLIVQGVCTTTPALSFSNNAFFTLDTESNGALPLLLERNVGATVAMVSLGTGVTLGLLTSGVEFQNLAGGVGIFDLHTATSSLVWLAKNGLSNPNGPIVTGVAGSTLEIILQDPLTQMPPTATAWPSPGFAGTLITAQGYVAPTYIYAPGSLSGAPNLFSNGEELRQCLGDTPGPKTVILDDTNGTCNGSGAWNLDNVTFVAQGSAPTGVMHFLQGATLAFSSLYLDGEAVISIDGTTDAWVDQAFAAVYMRGGSTIQCTSTGRFMAPAAAGHVVFVFADGGVIGDGTHAVFAPAAGTTLDVTATNQANVKNHALAGAGAQNIFASSDSLFGTNDGTGAITTTLKSLAGNEKYTATTAGNWNPNPGNVNAALDQLAAPNFKQSTAVVGGGTHTVTFVTAAITKAKSGIISVKGDCSGATAAADTITVTLQRDATVLRTKTITTTAGQLNYDVAMSFEDTAPDNAAHTYTLSLAGAQNNTVAANGGYVGARELN